VTATPAEKRGKAVKTFTDSERWAFWEVKTKKSGTAGSDSNRGRKGGRMKLKTIPFVPRGDQGGGGL